MELKHLKFLEENDACQDGINQTNSGIEIPAYFGGRTEVFKYKSDQ